MLRYLLICLTFLYTTQIWAEILQGKVVGVADGDTITVLDKSNTQYKVRLSGIDAPEKHQPFGQVSKQSLSDLAFSKEVVVEWTKQDRYKRIVGKVLVNNSDVNLEQVNRGLAWHFKKYQKEQPVADRESYSQAEEQAKLNKLGLWVDKELIPPWDWRKAKRIE